MDSSSGDVRPWAYAGAVVEVFSTVVMFRLGRW